ncbi:MAG: hypothetical protein B6D45_05390 [Ignavibacteriales bacterium UTCHB3]|nr:MAG: hypothetical protein B6D45_05390 [Ignavibacteriales bacterium UTCHB3]
MKNIKVFFFATIIALPLVLILQSLHPRHKKGFNFYPSEFFHQQRAYPNEDFPTEKYFKALEARDKMEVSTDAIASVNWEPAGPSNIGGRIAAFVADPADTNIMILGAAAGGIFKSTDAGATWVPKTDQWNSLSVGAMAMDPNNSDIIYCGTGEANISTDSYAGFGVLKSTDKGETWFPSGLENSRHIGEIKVHPMNSNIVYAAVSGGLYSKGPDRGVYKSTDAGATWEKVLFVSDSTSAVDVDIDPTDTNIVFAAMWERLRGPSFRKAAGASTALYRSTDGGTTWSKDIPGLPANNPKLGRISIAVAPSNPNFVYLLYKSASVNNGSDNNFYGFYRSTDRGASFTKMPDGILPGEFASFGWYFGQLDVAPNDHLKVYLGEVDFFLSQNGGNSWSIISNAYSSWTWEEQHPDHHTFWVNPNNPNHIIVGNDGGLFVTWQGRDNWKKLHDLPISQFYAIEVAFQNPLIVAGGTQDNGTLKTNDGGIDNWYEIYGGDGFHCKIDPTNSNVIYACSQNGGLGRSTNGGNSFSSITSGLDLSRTNWSTPYIIDPDQPSNLYLGSYKLFKTTNQGNSWTAVSPDLTKGPNGMLGTLTAVSVASYNNSKVLATGANDGSVYVSTDNGSNWQNRTAGLPNRYVTDVVVNRKAPNDIFVSLSGYNLDQSNPHVFLSHNFGENWTDISGNLPDVPVNSIIVDPERDSVLFIGTDVGVFFTKNLGATWYPLGEGLPNSPVFDLVYHAPSQVLYAGTHGRSIFAADVSVLTGVKEAGGLPVEFALKANYPNPFNPSTKIEFSVAEKGEYSLKVYNINGELVAQLLQGYLEPGSYSALFSGAGYTSGIYFYRLEGAGKAESRKMILMK